MDIKKILISFATAFILSLAFYVLVMLAGSLIAWRNLFVIMTVFKALVTIMSGIIFIYVITEEIEDWYY